MRTGRHWTSFPEQPVFRIGTAGQHYHQSSFRIEWHRSIHPPPLLDLIHTFSSILHSRDEPGRSVVEGQLVAVVTRAEDAMAQLHEREVELRDALVRSTTLEAEMAELRLRPQADEATGLHREVDELRLQLVSEQHRHELLRLEIRGLEGALSLVGRSRSSASRSASPADRKGTT
ncbi:hypothetical protein Taro_001896 [Colocasia esculenta]|uniref:Uncharacterized protein n=1 Tax=Colocasia esculenta TaxID=4460 RepID=A0A843TBA7_COLES|nr:hypothetical protein [Colocasia esculenta]